MRRHVSINIPEDSDRILIKYKDGAQSFTETVGQALRLYDYIRSREAEGSRIFVKDGQGKVMELHVI